MNKLLMILLLMIPIPRETQLMVEEGEIAGVKTVLTGTLHMDFIKASEDHAALQAKNQRQGHPDWETRYHKLRKKHPSLKIEEIASESWPGQTLREAAKDAFTVSWPASSGHWAIANKDCVYYGTSMMRASNGITYTSMIVGFKNGS